MSQDTGSATPTGEGRDYGDSHAGLALAVLPACLLAALWIVRQDGGPFWQWNLIDPSYFYLLDALNLVNLRSPGHIVHPGVTVEMLGAAAIRFRHLGVTADEITTWVLSNPEYYLRLISTPLIVLSALALWVLGLAAHKAFCAVVPALTVQAAPFMSTLVVKHGYLPKPEGMLVFATLALMTVIVLALRPGAMERRPAAFAVAFGVVAGFGVATKFTAAPIYLVPLVLFGRWRLIVIYGLSAAASLFVFTLPAVGVYPEIFAYVKRIALSSGAHYSVASQTVIDFDLYPGRVVRLLKRPALNVPLILAGLTFVVAIWRRRRAGDIRPLELRGLASTSLAQFAHVLFVAKHPAAFYMIPSYMLGALTVMLAVRLLWFYRPRVVRLPATGTVIGGLLLVIFLASQAVGIVRLDGELRNIRAVAASFDESRFPNCARIYVYAASSPVYALYLANMVTGSRFSETLKQLHPARDYWIDDWYDPSQGVLSNWDGDQEFQQVSEAYPCLMLRGSRLRNLDRYLSKETLARKSAFICPGGAERIATVGVDCRGNAVQ